jgi:hypothetical protein
LEFTTRGTWSAIRMAFPAQTHDMRIDGIGVRNFGDDVGKIKTD